MVHPLSFFPEGWRWLQQREVVDRGFPSDLRDCCGVVASVTLPVPLAVPDPDANPRLQQEPCEALFVDHCETVLNSAGIPLLKRRPDPSVMFRLKAAIRSRGDICREGDTRSPSGQSYGGHWIHGAFDESNCKSKKARKGEGVDGGPNDGPGTHGYAAQMGFSRCLVPILVARLSARISAQSTHGSLHG